MSEHLQFTQLAGADGELEGSIQWGEEEGLEPVLVHAISVPLGPLRLSEKASDETPALRLHSVRFGVRSWRELADRTYSFPNVVKTLDADGESHPVYDIYGSLQLGADYHQVLITTIAFGQFDGCRVGTSLTGSVRSVTDPPSFSPADFSCEGFLTIGPTSVRGDLGSSSVPTLAEAEKLTGSLLRLEDYGAPGMRNGTVLLKPSC
ncbi:hypothetical protein ACVBEQ_19930 [Nakamurella sp. GG22]